MNVPPAALWHGLRLVAPGQPLSERLRGLLSLSRRAGADAAQGREAVASLGGGGEHRIAVFGDRPLDVTADSASHRLGWLLRLAIGDGWQVSFYSVRQRHWFDVDHGLCLSPSKPPQGAGVGWVVRPEAAALVMPALASLRPGPRVVYDSMDLHYLRLEREGRVSGSRGLALQARLMKKLERQVSSRADVAVAISEQEAPLLRQLAGSADVVVLPNVHEPREDQPPPLTARSGLLFVGNFTHTPNVDAVETLARQVMPRIWEHSPELVLSVAGRGLAPGGLDERIGVLGFVDDLDALMDRSCALVAPLRFGAGLKGKIGYALARGLPVVTTPVGVEGFAEAAGMVVVPDGDWQGFADNTLELLRDAVRWSRSSAAGIELIRRRYSPDALVGSFRRILEP